MARFLVTRAMPEAEDTAAQIITLGHEAIVAPLRHVDAVLAPVPARPEALIATSANAFCYGTSIPADWHDLPVYCVGERTAQAARLRGFTHIEAVQDDVEALLVSLATPEAQAQHALYLVGEPRKPILEEWYSHHSRFLTLWPRYRMLEKTALPDAARNALQAKTCNAVLHFSAESAATLIRLAEAAGLISALHLPLHICLSESIAARVRGAIRGVRIIVSEKKDTASLLNAAISALA